MSREVPINLVLGPNATRYRIKFHQGHVLAIWNTDGYHLYKVTSVGRLIQSFSHRRGNNADPIIVEPITFYNGTRLENVVAVIRQNPIDGTVVMETQLFESFSEIVRPAFVFVQPVLSFASSRDYLAVCFEQSINIYDIQNNGNIRGESLRVINTDRNEYGFCAINDRYLVFPRATYTYPLGILDIRILNEELTRLTVLYAHRRHPVIALTFSVSGASLATASKIHIRVFSVVNFGITWPLLYQFNIDASEIPTLNFSRCAEYIVCNGSSPTIYIFRLTEDNKLTNMLAGVYHVHRPPIDYNYSITIPQPYPIQKVVAVRYVYNTLYLYVFNEYAVYELYFYNTTLKRFVSFGPQNFAGQLVQNIRPPSPPPPHLRGRK